MSDHKDLDHDLKIITKHLLVDVWKVFSKVQSLCTTVYIGKMVNTLTSKPVQMKISMRNMHVGKDREQNKCPAHVRSRSAGIFILEINPISISLINCKL